MSDDILDRIAKYKDAPGVYFHIRETLEKSRDEILRLRAALASERERCAKVAENYKDREKVRTTDFTMAHDFAAERIAAAIRALPKMEPQS